MDFSDQVIIVTGGTRGIGRGIAEAFLKSKGVVIATYVENEKAALLMKEECDVLYPNKLFIQRCDVRSEKSVIDFFAYVREKFSKFHVLVNNSGIRKDQLTAGMSLLDWNDVIDTNLTGTFLMSKHAVLEFMKFRYGRIVNMSSIGGNLGLAGQANYAASKAGQVAISKSLSKEVAKRGITVNNICPGFIETELLADLSSELRAQYIKEIPLKRFGKIEEVACAVLFLASGEASYITGASLDISGGL